MSNWCKSQSADWRTRWPAIVDKTYKQMSDLESAEQRCPEKFEAKKDSGHIYFEFNRKPLEKPKK